MNTDKQGQLVLLDASVLEARYLAPILRSDSCHDVNAIIDAGYKPAISQKSLAEVWTHAKLGVGNSSIWAREHPDYPKPLDSVVAAISKAEPGLDARRTAWFWFNLSEEWQVFPGQLGTIRRDFQHWKEGMKRFCLGVKTALELAGITVVSPWWSLTDPRDQLDSMNTEREIAINSILPSVDSAWIVDAVILGARAVVTCDKDVIERGRPSLRLNLGAPSFVHPSCLNDALQDGFALGIYQETS